MKWTLAVFAGAALLVGAHVGRDRLSGAGCNTKQSSVSVNVGRTASLQAVNVGRSGCLNRQAPIRQTRPASLTAANVAAVTAQARAATDDG